MKILIIAFIILLADTKSNFPINIDRVKKIKNEGHWKPSEVSTNKFKGWSISHIKSILGVTKDSYRNDENDIVRSFESRKKKCPFNISIPDEFDGRLNRTNCTGPVIDQGDCGSCWAFGAVETLSDLFCLAKNYSTYLQLSTQDPVSCDRSNDGCDGGYLSSVFKYLTNKGVVTESCFPYKSGEAGRVPRCPTKCVNRTEKFTKYKCKKNSVVNLGGNSTCIQSWIYANGPMELGFYVYEDFMNYQSGV